MRKERKWKMCNSGRCPYEYEGNYYTYPDTVCRKPFNQTCPQMEDEETNGDEERITKHSD